LEAPRRALAWNLTAMVQVRADRLQKRARHNGGGALHKLASAVHEVIASRRQLCDVGTLRPTKSLSALLVIALAV